MPVPGGLRPGMSVYVQGMVPHHTKRFRVNFSCGGHEGADIALHFNPRFDGKDKIVLNSFRGGSWGKEQIQSMPLRKGHPFEVVFIVNNDGYQILVDRNPFCTFEHRIPPEHVQVLNADGDLELQSLNLMGGAMMGPGVSILTGQEGGFPKMPPPEVPAFLNSVPEAGAIPTLEPQVPYRGNLAGGLGSKSTVVLKGFVPPNGKRFHINFKAGPQDIALHINPRMDERVVVRNSLLNGNWGPEERELSFNPFQPGQYFDLSIRCGNHRFKVFANGQHLFDFNHRFHNFQQINMLEIDGDVNLSYIQY
uniref:Galectin n=1 Tax=Varanus komodoensis TaxID=61221 RepID=A0A8D2Q5Q8_VARKO